MLRAGHALKEDALFLLWRATPRMALGSSPNVVECAAEQTFRVKLQLESRDAEALERAVAAVRGAIECFEPATP